MPKLRRKKVTDFENNIAMSPNLPQTAPYGMLRDSSNQLVGNDRFEGFGIDIIQELSLMLGFKYQFQLQEDGVYGNLNNVTREWNGMIRNIRDGVR